MDGFRCGLWQILLLLSNRSSRHSAGMCYKLHSNGTASLYSFTPSSPSPALPLLPRPLLDQAIHFSFATLLLFSSLSLTLCNKNDNQKSNNDDIKDLNFLEEPDDVVATSHYDHFPDPNQFDKDGDNDEDKFSDFAGFDHSLEEAFKESKVDDKDVIIFKKHNFTITVKNNCFVHGQALCALVQPLPGPHAKVHRRRHRAQAQQRHSHQGQRYCRKKLASEYDVHGFPTVFFFINGVHKPYTGQRTKECPPYNGFKAFVLSLKRTRKTNSLRIPKVTLQFVLLSRQAVKMI
ncbi:hypothetical protein JHK82_040368 [Glycine max]|nr:hypothetical protein JHK82_040368 [Glycine max]